MVPFPLNRKKVLQMSWKFSHSLTHKNRLRIIYSTLLRLKIALLMYLSDFLFYFFFYFSLKLPIRVFHITWFRAVVFVLYQVMLASASSSNTDSINGFQSSVVPLFLYCQRLSQSVTYRFRLSSWALIFCKMMQMFFWMKTSSPWLSSAILPALACWPRGFHTVAETLDELNLVVVFSLYGLSWSYFTFGHNYIVIFYFFWVK